MNVKLKPFKPSTSLLMPPSFSSSSILPKLQVSINTHNVSVLTNLERRVKYFKEQCDYSYYKNQSLTFQLRDMQKIEVNDSSFGKEALISADIFRKITEIEEKIARVEDGGRKVSNERVRIFSILNICKKNKQVEIISSLPSSSLLLPPPSSLFPPPSSLLPPPSSLLPPPSFILPPLSPQFTIIKFPPPFFLLPPPSFLVPPPSSLLPLPSSLLPPASFLLPPPSFLLPLLFPQFTIIIFFSKMRNIFAL